MLCSILIPSRFHFDKLFGCIESINKAATGTDFEIVIRFHNDDRGSMDRVGELSRFSNVRFISGETFDGYKSLHVFAQELEDVAQGDWHWHVNDDMVVTGEAWDEKLSLMPDNVLVQPEFHRLGDSIYTRDRCGPAPIYYKDAMKRCDHPILAGAPDVTIYTELVINHGWEVRYLEGVGIWHQWDPDGHSIYPEK